LEPIKEGENNAYYLIRTGRLLNLQEPSFFLLKIGETTHTHTHIPHCNVTTNIITNKYFKALAPL
jgi:hypothetical protein